MPPVYRSWRYRIEFTQEMIGTNIEEFQPGTERPDEKAWHGGVAKTTVMGGTFSEVRKIR